jgi:putative ABC transport system permease protein
VTFLSGQLGVMRFLIAVIIVLGVSNMLIMNVLERTGEIGTLMALGIRRRKVVALFLTESFYLGLIGGVIGIVLGLACAKLISSIGVPMPPPPGRTSGYVGAILVTGPILFSAFAVTLVTTLLAGLYPARKASRLVIVDALRHNR